VLRFYILKGDMRVFEKRGDLRSLLGWVVRTKFLFSMLVETMLFNGQFHSDSSHEPHVCCNHWLNISIRIPNFLIR